MRGRGRTVGLLTTRGRDEHIQITTLRAMKNPLRGSKTLSSQPLQKEYSRLYRGGQATRSTRSSHWERGTEGNVHTLRVVSETSVEERTKWIKEVGQEDTLPRIPGTVGLVGENPNKVKQLPGNFIPRSYEIYESGPSHVTLTFERTRSICSPRVRPTRNLSSFPKIFIVKVNST